MTMRLFGLIATGNDARRYLQANLAWHAPAVDQLIVADDGFQPAAAELIEAAGATWAPAFASPAPTRAEHEGKFRQWALEMLEACCQPEPGDWVLSLDADEFLVGYLDLRDTMRDAVRFAARFGAASIRLPHAEMWDCAISSAGELIDPYARVDGVWGRESSVRLYAWRRNGQIPRRTRQAGHAPTYIGHHAISEMTVGLRTLGYGYASPEDRYARLEFPGEPRLTPYGGPQPTVWRGVRVG